MLLTREDEDIINMSVYFAQSNSNIIDIGTSTGVLLDGIYKINKGKKIRCVGIDIEKAMIDECNSRYEGMEFEVCDASEYKYDNCSIVTAMLTLQFMKKDERKKVLKKVLNY